MIKIDIAQGEIFKPCFKDLSGFIGQESVIKKIKFFAMSNSNETPFPTLLFSGSHGLGKTFLAEKVSKVLQRDFISVNCSSIKSRKDFIENVIFKIKKPTTIFLDESHQLSNEITTTLLSILNPTKENKNILKCGAIDIIYDLRFINIIFATTDAHIMFRPLKNRCFKVYFSPYNKFDLMSILEHYLDGVKIECDINDITDSCRSRARDAYLLSQNIKRYLSFNGGNKISNQDWSNIKTMLDIYPRGLNKEEVDLLKIVKDSGPISCSSLALKLMVNEDNIKSELEVRLRELGFIQNTTKGRQITNEGLEYFVGSM